MAQKKNYSRYFIILQEDEKGYGIAKDKNPTGYVKLEVKADKCKVSYYVQNLKKETSPYYVILICGKKGENKIVKIGEVNIDDYGRTDVSNEYSSNNLANTGVDVDKVCGAAIIKLLDSNIVPIMSGFTSANIPKWKGFKMLEDKTRKSNNQSKSDCKSEKDKVSKQKPEEKNVFDKYEQNIEKSKKEEKDINKDIKLNEEHNKGIIKEAKENSVVQKDKENKKDIKETKPKSEDKKVKEEVEEIKKETKSEYKNKDEKNKSEKAETKKEAKLEVKDKSGEKVNSEVKEEIKREIKQEITEELKERSLSENKKSPECKNHYNSDTEKSENSIKLKENINSVDDCMLVDNTIVENDFANRGYICNEHIKRSDCAKGKEAEFLKNVLKDFKQMEGLCPEIKRCCWHKIEVSKCKDMYDISDFNKYNVVYYPMINYYSYINKYCHYILGYKWDDSGNIKYIVYGVPGTKSKEDQPYEGKSGFVTWIPSNEKKDFGYWLMFYDFRSSTILIPIK